jgi:hypothetical protein
MAKNRMPKELLRALELIRTPQRKLPKSLDALEARHIRRVRDIFKDRNVVGIGIAKKEIGKKSTGEFCLCFYVEKKYSKTRGKPDLLIPPVLSIGKRTAVFTDVQEIGKIRLHLNRQQTPIESGYSVGDASATGTLGAIVKKGGDYFLLSSSHVLADSGNGKIGDPIMYPGPLDTSGGAAQYVAHLSAFVPFQKAAPVNRVDAALAQVDDNFVGSLDFSIYKGSTPTDIIDPAIDMKIAIRGRKSGNSRGSVKSVTFSYYLDYPGVGEIGFVDQVACSSYADEGDSGALVVDQASGKIVGLHCGGSESFSLFNPISEVVKALKFRFV